jgi:hypothetical protein
MVSAGTMNLPDFRSPSIFFKNYSASESLRRYCLTKPVREGLDAAGK